MYAQRCLALCNLMDCSPPGTSVRGFPRQEYCSGLHSLLQKEDRDLANCSVNSLLLGERQVKSKKCVLGESESELCPVTGWVAAAD